MESSNNDLANLDQVRLIQALGTIMIREEAGASLPQMLEASNPALARLGAAVVERSTRGFNPDKTQRVGDTILRTLLTLEEYPKTAISISLADRAQALLRALDHIGEDRKLGGFDIASDLESRHLPQMTDRYKDKLPWVRQGASKKRPRIYKDAHWEFADGIGHFVATNSGFINPEDARGIARNDFDNFIKTYFTDPDAESNRLKFRRKLNRHITKS